LSEETEQYEKWVKPERFDFLSYDHRADGESTYLWADERGPLPVPDWVITDGSATERDLGVLKTGKEADVSLVERTFDGQVNLLAAKRYRDTQHRQFRNDAAYRASKVATNSREERAAAKQSRFGSSVRAHGWAVNEMARLNRLWAIGVRVPYPVQRNGTEVMLEYIGDEEHMAPRLVNAGGGRRELAALCEQAVDALRKMTWDGLVHADLSPYNVLAWEGELVIIDLPQAVDLDDNPNAYDFLQRDVANLLGWFAKRGVDVDPQSVFADLLDLAFDPTRERGDRRVITAD
jgi:RIO kinase 1